MGFELYGIHEHLDLPIRFRRTVCGTESALPRWQPGFLHLELGQVL